MKVDVDVFVESSNVLRELDGLKEDIYGYRKKYEESVQKSLEVYFNIRRDYIMSDFDLILLLMTEDESSGNIEQIYYLLKKTKESMRILQHFVLSEIVHRKLQNVRFKLTNPFFFRKSKEEFRNITYELEDLDEIASSKKERAGIKCIAERYDNLIKRIRSLEDGLGEERKTGLISYLKWLIPGLSGWIAAILMFFNVYAAEYLQIYFGIFAIFALVASLFLIPLLLLFWNYFSYGFRQVVQQKLLLVIPLLPIAFLIIFSLGGPIEKSVLVLILSWSFGILLGISLPLFDDYKKNLLKKEIESLMAKFFG